ncbi:2-amino-4-hydroxy-6-hydroxymethyldihydropteridine diphosphokinase [Cellulosimicrobium terreum]|nr:2-amino-4-hydroxy-6-hydroxymethyldihydropteridine diphosphokinase [Cellulosimicrobium terreum]
MTTAFAGAVLDADGRPFDRIRLTGLSATGHHGVYEHEKVDGQLFRADVVLHLDTRAAARGDDLGSTVSYAGVADDVVAVLAGSPADLVETVAERIAATILTHEEVVAVDVAVHKPQAPLDVEFDDVEVVIRRDRVVVPVVAPLSRSSRRPEPERPVQGPIPVGSVAPALIHGVEHVAEPELAPAPAVMPPSIPPATSTAGGADGTDGSGEQHVVPQPATDVSSGSPSGTPDPAVPPAPPVPPVPPVPTDTTGLGAVPDATDTPMPTVEPVPAGDVDGAVAADRVEATDEQVDADMTAHAAAEAPGPFEDAPTASTPPPAPVAPREAERERDRMDDVPAGFVDVVLALGANLGEAQQTLRDAITDLDRISGIEITEVSPLARTEAVGGPDQPDYLNAVLLARTRLSARDLLHACQSVENAHGRERTERWGARTLDVDLVVYGNLTDVADDLELPHPRAHERAFVLEPWSQVDPGAVLPGLGGGPVSALAATAPDRSGIRWLALDWLTEPAPHPTGAVPEVSPAPPAPPVPDAPAPAPTAAPTPVDHTPPLDHHTPLADQYTPPAHEADDHPHGGPQPDARLATEHPADPVAAPQAEPEAVTPAWIPRATAMPVPPEPEPEPVARPTVPVFAPVPAAGTDETPVAPAPQVQPYAGPHVASSDDTIIRGVPFAPVHTAPSAPGPLADRSVQPPEPAAQSHPPVTPDPAPEVPPVSWPPFAPVSSHPGDPQR